MSVAKKLCKAVTPRFINSHSEFIYVLMGVPILPLVSPDFMGQIYHPFDKMDSRRPGV
jgi:hypothetical protein